MNIKLGAVEYLNARPLYHALGENLTLARPVELARQLRAGALDAALVPLVECLECPEYVLVNDVGIGCDGPVTSVFLAHETPLAQLTRVGLDAASKTSVQLLRVVLEVFHQLRPAYVPEKEPAQGRLWIGDPALTFRREQPHVPILDLGEAWKAATGLPFIFAVWAIRPRAELDVAQVADFLRGKAREGLAAREQMATTPEEYAYLTHSIRYELGDPQREAIDLFAKHLVALEVLPQAPALQWA